MTSIAHATSVTVILPFLALLREVLFTATPYPTGAGAADGQDVVHGVGHHIDRMFRDESVKAQTDASRKTVGFRSGISLFPCLAGSLKQPLPYPTVPGVDDGVGLEVENVIVVLVFEQGAPGSAAPASGFTER